MPARKKSNSSPPLDFDKKLILQQWIFSLLEAKDLEKLCDEEFRHPDAEAWDTENVTEFHHLLTRYTVERQKPPNALLRAFDENIVRHTQRINGRRKEPIRWKYYQYIALLFTEIYLHWYFHRPAELLAGLNSHLDAFNAEQDKATDRFDNPYTEEDLRKLCFWQATGSGKTLQMHVNILQYLHYLEKAGKRRELNKIILLTPNEGLSMQHLKEFSISGIDAEIFDKEGTGQATMFSGYTVEIIDVNKLAEESKDKTVAVDCFEGNNLVMVDEGHRGHAGEKWMERREALCRDGFSFEYSATFGQAVKAAKDTKMEQNYARWILFDYSYRFFHKDGYGKNYRIFNLSEHQDEEQRELYLTGALLSFYQQLRLWEDHREDFATFNIERPLWAFFGAKVNAGEISDIVDVLLFLAKFTANRALSVTSLNRLLTETDGLIDTRQQSIFSAAFPYLKKINLTGEEAFDGILRSLFNSPGGGKIHVCNIRSAKGELSLSLGVAEPFGVINVGDEKTLHDRCSEHPKYLIADPDREFGESLFKQLAQPNSRIHLVLGSRKFTEGWNSWRVSAIGLMNLGRKEGSEIIQLFGRGVRLKGWNMTLKRSDALKRINHEVMQRATESQRRFLSIVETLDVFGVRADYMKQFKEYLETEGIATDPEWEEVEIPIIPSLSDLPSRKLKVVRVPENLNYKRDAPRPQFQLEADYFKRFPVVVDWYPRIEALKATGQSGAVLLAKRDTGSLNATHLAFLDYEALYLRLQQFKTVRGYNNLRLEREQIACILANPHWYNLYIPQEELEPTRFERVRIWQQIAEALLTGYCDRLYRFRKQSWESQHAAVFELTDNDPNFLQEYTFRIQQGETELIEQIQTLKEKVTSGTWEKFAFARVNALRWDKHLYSPLIHINGNSVIEVTPVSLNPGEWKFIEDLKKFNETHKEFFEKKELFVLRNRSKKGIGFFEAGNFYPDFIVWLIEGARQHVCFVDPKGLMHTQGLNDPKIAFAEKIKELEARLRPDNPDLYLESFILSTTSFKQIHWWDKLKTESDFAEAHILLQKDQPDSYISRMFELITRR